MKKTYLYIIIAVLGLLLLSLLTYKKTSYIKFKDNNNYVFNIDTISLKNTKKITHNFKYINNIHPKLTIYGVKDICDCTKTEVKKGTYEFGDTINIKVNYYPSVYNERGEVSKNIFVITDKTVSEHDSLLLFTINSFVKE